MNQVVAAIADAVVSSRSGSGVVAIGIDPSARCADNSPLIVAAYPTASPCRACASVTPNDPSNHTLLSGFGMAGSGAKAR